MRTEADLHVAFGLLERVVDDHLAVKVTAGETVVLLPARRPPRRRALLIGAVAVVTVLIAFGTVVTYRVVTRSSEPAGGTVPVRSMLFTLRPIPNVRLLSASVERGVPTRNWSPQEVTYLAPDGRYRVDLSAAQPIGTGVLAAHRGVDVNGRRAILGCLADRGLTLATCSNLAVAWPYAARAWVVVFVDGDRGTESTLLRIARALDFDQPLALTTPFRLSRAPQDGRLQRVETTPGDADDAGFYPSWLAGAEYDRDGGGRVIIWVSAGSLHRMPNSRRVTVDGHAGYWSDKNRVLNYAAGPGAQVQIGFDREHASLSGALAIARTLTLVDHPDRLSSWLLADQALP